MHRAMYSSSHGYLRDKYAMAMHAQTCMKTTMSRFETNARYINIYRTWQPLCESFVAFSINNETVCEDFDEGIVFCSANPKIASD